MKNVRQCKALFLAILIAIALPAVSSAIDATTPVTRVSTNANGAEAVGGSSLKTTVSSDGRYVVFRSDATNLVPNDTNGVSDVFVKDVETGVVTCVSNDSAQTPGNGPSINPSISANGLFVVFQSTATNLVQNDTNALSDVFVKNLVTLQTTRVSTDSAGVQASGASGGSPVLSGDGRHVAFLSVATNLVPGDTNGVQDAFVKDLQNGATTRVSTDSAGVQANGVTSSGTSAISADGRYVAFASGATNLVSDDTNAVADLFVKDLQNGATTRVSTDSAGVQANGAVATAGGGGFSFSGNGRYVAFISAATNMVPGDTNGFSDVFTKDLATGVTTLVSSDVSGAWGNGATIVQPPAFSYDGRYIVFASDATNLVPADTNGVSDAFIKDTTKNAIVRLSTDSAGLQANMASGGYAISSNSKHVVFTSAATNLVGGDMNNATDVFYRVNPFWVESTVPDPSSTPFVPGAPNAGVPPAQSDQFFLTLSIIATALWLAGAYVVKRRYF